MRLAGLLSRHPPPRTRLSSPTKVRVTGPANIHFTPSSQPTGPQWMMPKATESSVNHLPVSLEKQPWFEMLGLGIFIVLF